MVSRADSGWNPIQVLEGGHYLGSLEWYSGGRQDPLDCALSERSKYILLFIRVQYPLRI